MKSGGEETMNYTSQCMYCGEDIEAGNSRDVCVECWPEGGRMKPQKCVCGHTLHQHSIGGKCLEVDCCCLLFDLALDRQVDEPPVDA